MLSLSLTRSFFTFLFRIQKRFFLRLCSLVIANRHSFCLVVIVSGLLVSGMIKAAWRDLQLVKLTVLLEGLEDFYALIFFPKKKNHRSSMLHNIKSVKCSHSLYVTHEGSDMRPRDQRIILILTVLSRWTIEPFCLSEV